MVRPFLIAGQPAIPASSLRGLISSIVEAASNSSFRVLVNRLYSVRATMEEFLPAIGMIVVQPGGERTLRPLAFGPSYRPRTQPQPRSPRSFGGCSPIPRETT